MTDENRKDLIIIGAGINGLSAGLAFALNNDIKHKKVLIVEKGPFSGGYVNSYTRKGFQFDTCQMISNVTDILEYFGIKLEMYEFKQDFIKIFKVDLESSTVKTIELFSGKEEFQKQLIRLFPEQSILLKKYFDYSSAMFDELYGLKYSPNIVDILKMLLTCPKVLLNASKDFEKYLAKFDLDNPEINLIFQVFSSLCGLPNNKIAALLNVGVMYSLLEKAYRPEGLFIDLPQKIEKRFLELGGEILFKSEVNSIIVKKGKAKGICLKDGTTYYSKNIISTIDVKTTMSSLLGKDVLKSISPQSAKRIELIEMTTSAFTVNLGLDDDILPEIDKLKCGYALLTSGDSAFQKLYHSFEKGESALSDECFYLGLSCPPTENGRKPILSIQSVPMPMQNWKDLRNTDRDVYISQKEKIADLLINIVEKYLIPDLRKHIFVKDISTPATYSRYSGSPTGSIYDMASIPANFGNNRLPIITPIQGLLLPKFAHGVFGAMNSGLQAVDILLGGKVMQGNSRFKKQ